MNAAPSDGAGAEHYEQDDAKVEEQSDSGTDATYLMGEWLRTKAPDAQNERGSEQESDDREFGEASLLGG